MRHVVYDATWACWGLAGLVWAAGAALVHWRGAAVARRADRDLSSLAGLGAGLIVAETPAALWRPLTVDSPWMRIAGLAMLVVATAGAIWSRVALGAMWSSAAVTRQRHALRTTGPYAATRHPIYTAILCMVLGTALTQGLGRWVAVLAAVALVVLIKVHAEERLLSREFPGEYERYRERVPRLIPRP